MHCHVAIYFKNTWGRKKKKVNCCGWLSKILNTVVLLPYHMVMDSEDGAAT